MATALWYGLAGRDQWGATAADRVDWVTDTIKVSLHTATPVPHDTEPVRHGAPGLELHAAPAVQAAQVPEPLQTPPVQAVPAPFGAPSVQTAEPLVQSMTPSRQAELGLLVHGPTVQVMQTPAALQSPEMVPATQDVLAGFAAPSLQVFPDGPHTVVPSLQPAWLGFPVQEVAATHATQVGPTHTPPVHALPAATFETLPQVAPPTPQLTLPWVHCEGVHTAPGEHGVHAPLESQTPPGQAVPAGLLLASTQTEAPVLHWVAPSLQGAPTTAHATPARQATQVPPGLQTWSTPHPVPGGWFVPRSVQNGPPAAAQFVEPARQGAATG